MISSSFRPSEYPAFPKAGMNEVRKKPFPLRKLRPSMGGEVSFSNRLIFVFSLLGLIVSSFLFYEYNTNGPVVCPIGTGCDIVRASPYSYFLGISIPILGIAFYLVMAVLSVMRSHKLFNGVLVKLQLLVAVVGVVFGIYLTFLEIFAIKAFCFWCVLSFIISLGILLAIVLARRHNDNRN